VHVLVSMNVRETKSPTNMTGLFNSN